MKTTVSQILAFQCDRDFWLVSYSSMHAMINPYIVFDLFCVFIDDGVRNVCGPLKRVQIYSYLEGLKIIIEF